MNSQWKKGDRVTLVKFPNVPAGTVTEVDERGLVVKWSSGTPSPMTHLLANNILQKA